MSASSMSIKTCMSCMHHCWLLLSTVKWPRHLLSTAPWLKPQISAQLGLQLYVENLDLVVMVSRSQVDMAFSRVMVVMLEVGLGPISASSLCFSGKGLITSTNLQCHPKILR